LPERERRDKREKKEKKQWVEFSLKFQQKNKKRFRFSEAGYHGFQERFQEQQFQQPIGVIFNLKIQVEAIQNRKDHGNNVSNHFPITTLWTISRRGNRNFLGIFADILTDMPTKSP
jgi:hypothetical protein